MITIMRLIMLVIKQPATAIILVEREAGKPSPVWACYQYRHEATRVRTNHGSRASDMYSSHADMSCADISWPQERERLTSKTLSRVSSSRERFLVERRKDKKAQPEAGPGASVSSDLDLYLSLEDGLEAAQMANTIRNIKEG